MIEGTFLMLEFIHVTNPFLDGVATFLMLEFIYVTNTLGHVKRGQFT